MSLICGHPLRQTTVLPHLVVSLPLGTLRVEYTEDCFKCASVKYTRSMMASVRLSLGLVKL